MGPAWLQTITGKIAEKWLVSLLTPAFTLWLVGCIAIVVHGDLPVLGWGLISLVHDPPKGEPPKAMFERPIEHLGEKFGVSDISGEVQALLFIIGAFLVVATTAAMLERITRPALQRVEGYFWPMRLRPVRKIRKCLVGRNVMQLEVCKMLRAELKTIFCELEINLQEQQGTRNPRKIQRLRDLRNEHTNKFANLKNQLNEDLVQGGIPRFPFPFTFFPFSCFRKKLHEQDKEQAKRQLRRDAERVLKDKRLKEEYDSIIEHYGAINPEDCRKQLRAIKECIARLDQELRSYPDPDTGQVMPTKLGNILRANEVMPYKRYGLDASVCWPRLWAILPDQVRTDISHWYEDLKAGTVLYLCGILMFVWIIWAWPAAIVAIFVVRLSYRDMLSSAASYGELIGSAFDTYRWGLYEALHWPLPEHPGKESEDGKKLTQYLYYGLYGLDVLDHEKDTYYGPFYHTFPVEKD